MQPFVIGALLDAGGRDLARAAMALCAAGALALLVMVLAPVALLGQLAHVGQPSVPGAAPVVRGAGALPEQPPLALAPARSQQIEVARRYLGVPYVFGGTNPAIGLDCSGLVQLVFRQLGVLLPRTAQLQYTATARVDTEQLQPGDLVFFARTYPDPNDWVTHVGIYIGNGQQINAPTEGQTVSIQPVFTGFWGAHYAGGGRVRVP